MAEIESAATYGGNGGRSIPLFEFGRESMKNDHHHSPDMYPYLAMWLFHSPRNAL